MLDFKLKGNRYADDLNIIPQVHAGKACVDFEFLFLGFIFYFQNKTSIYAEISLWFSIHDNIE